MLMIAASLLALRALDSRSARDPLRPPFPTGGRRLH